MTDFEFLLATSQIGEMNANGVLGLAPTTGTNSIVQMLSNHAQFKGKAIIGMNYENPIDTHQ